MSIKKENDLMVIDSESVQLVPKDAGIINESKCKLCKWDKRQNAESYYIQTKNYLSTHKWINDQGLKVAYSAVRNHMIYHFLSTLELETLREYEKDVKQWSSERHDMIDEVVLRTTVLKRRMIKLDADIDGYIHPEEKRRGAEQVRKMAETILGHEKQLKEFKNEAKPIQIVIEQLGIIVNNELASNDIDDKSKKLLISVVDKLRSSVPAKILDGGRE